MKAIEKKKLDRARRQHVRRLRFMAGLRNLATLNPAKLLALLGYLLAVVWVWCSRGTLPLPFSNGDIFDTMFRSCFSLVILLIAGVLLPEVIIALGTPLGATRIQNDLTEAGFTNSVGLPPLLLCAYKGESKRSRIYEFDPNNVPFSQWESDKNEIGAALKRIITSISQSKDGKRIILHTVPMRSAFPDKIYWKDEYLSPDANQG